MLPSTLPTLVTCARGNLNPNSHHMYICQRWRIGYKLCLTIYIFNGNRITRWVDEEEDRIKASGGNSLQYVILDMSGNYFS